MKRIAIIGSGFFGITCALILSKKHKIDIFEKKNAILCGASRANQMRFHLGYHYPRSIKTTNEIKRYYNEFENFFGKDVFGNTKNFYGISKINSKTNYSKYLNFLKKNKLNFSILKNIDFSSLVEGSILSKEKTLNYFRLKEKIQKKIKKTKVNIYLNTEFKKSMLRKYDKIIISVYDQNNNVLKKLGIKNKKRFKYELVEKIIIKLPKKYKNKSFMVIDGKFVCVDPYLGTNYHLLSDNKNSKIEIKKSVFPNFKDFRKKYLNSVPIKNIKISRYRKFIEHGSKFLPILKKSKYISSFYITRAIEINKEKTDERVNKIKIYKNKFITIFSGKWNTCVGLAKNINKILLNDKK